LATALAASPLPGVEEVVPSLASVLVRYNPLDITPTRLAGELSLLASAPSAVIEHPTFTVAVRFGGDDGPDLNDVAQKLGLEEQAFIDRHNAAPLRVLTTGFAPGFVYCGFHPETLTLPRRSEVRAKVPVGSVLFAAGQTAIAATDIPTGWHVIGRTDFRNFDASQMPPTRLTAGDQVKFEAIR
jgi:KipI family sensor histidine kinase inhibitor